MKSEERHHLAENDLEKTLNRWLDKLEPYSNHILGGILLVTALVVGGILWKRTAQAAVDDGWTMLSDARTADDFVKVADAYPESSAAPWAELRAARLYYDQGVETSLTDRKTSNDDFKQAKDLFEKLLKSKVAPEIREGALDGMARTLESTSDGDTAEAIKTYETLISEFPESIYRDYAKYRIDVLKKPETKEFLVWFSKQNPKPADRPKPTDGAAGSNLTTPDPPNFDSKDDAKGAIDPFNDPAKTTEKPAATDKPATSEGPPAATTPPADPAATPPAPEGEVKEDAAPAEKPADAPAATPQEPAKTETPAPPASGTESKDTPPPSDK
jgi:hypothetical protein